MALAALGCQVEVEHGLSETDANSILVALERSDIPATKEREEGGREVTWAVAVPRGEMARAMEVLVTNGLPPPKSQGIAETFPGGGMIPSGVEEQMRKLAAEQGELSATLSAVDGVLLARVHLNLPQPTDLEDRSRKPVPTASVLIKYRASAKDDKPPLTVQQVQALVSRAVEDMSPDNVSVVFDRATPAGGDAAAGQFVDVLGLRMSNDSVGAFKVMAFAVLLIILGLSTWVALLYMRASPAPARPPRTTSRAGPAET